MQLNKIYNEDCLITMGKMQDCFIDLTVTSPPYDDMRDYHGYQLDIKKVAAELYRVTKKGGIVVWIVSDKTSKGSESGTSFKQALTFMDCGFRLMDTMIYKKSPNGSSGNNKLYWQGFDYMFVFSKGAPKTINLIMDRKNKESRNGDNGTRRSVNGELKKVVRGGYGQYGRRTNVWEYVSGKGNSTKDQEAFEHPAIFPEALAKDHIISWSKPNDLVYDCFMGSGTTAKMAFLTKRNYIGSEISTVYCEIANRRLKKYTNKNETKICKI